MSLKLNVPELDSPEAADAVREVILSAEPDTKVNIDLNSKTVMIEGSASEETFKQLIEAAGYQISER
jgi:copper chaperone